MKADMTLDQEDVTELIIRYVRERLGPMADEWTIEVPDYAVRDVTVRIKDKAELARDARYRAEMEARKARAEAASAPAAAANNDAADATAMALATIDSDPF